MTNPESNEALQRRTIAIHLRQKAEESRALGYKRKDGPAEKTREILGLVLTSGNSSESIQKRRN